MVMVSEVPFQKYTSYGNNFVIVDEINSHILTEAEKPGFAYQATNVNYGVGSDNFLVIQSCVPKTLREINKAHEYWDEIPDYTAADFIFRMFEPSGEEALSCANGLMCIANYLYHRYGIDSARIMTEIPTAEPRVVKLGSHDENKTNWTQMGHPRQIPPDLSEPSSIKPYDDAIGTIEEIEITFRKHDLAPFARAQTLKISGYLVFTGEPHLVIFPETGFSLEELSKMIFVSSSEASSEIDTSEKRISFGSWLINHIGTYINKNYTHIFPKGINVNFARVVDNSGVIEYRCFERGIYRETFACGTGALAVSFVLQRLNLLDKSPITAWPHRCRWNNPEAHILIEETDHGWALYGNPFMLFEGRFLFQRSLHHPKSAIDSPTLGAEQSVEPGVISSCNSTSLQCQSKLQVNSNCGLVA
jgi:diaminopimelate epimerase